MARMIRPLPNEAALAVQGGMCGHFRRSLLRR